MERFALLVIMGMMVLAFSRLFFVPQELQNIQQQKIKAKKAKEKTQIIEPIKQIKQPIIEKPKPKKKQSIVSQKKQNFINNITPIVKEIYNELYTKYLVVKYDINNAKKQNYIQTLKKQYKAKTDQELLAALKPHPISITLAQCAIESAWLTSRFTKEANNLFGVWSFNKNEPRIAASGLRGDKTIYLKKYNNYYESIKDYYKNVSKSWAYKEFRFARLKTNNPYELIKHLSHYSEKGEEYIELLRKVIEKNRFTQYD